MFCGVPLLCRLDHASFFHSRGSFSASVQLLSNYHLRSKNYFAPRIWKGKTLNTSLIPHRRPIDLCIILSHKTPRPSILPPPASRASTNPAEIALTICVSPAACLLCCPIGDSVGRALVVKRLVKLPRASLVDITPPDSRFGFLAGESGLVEKLEKGESSRGDCGPR